MQDYSSDILFLDTIPEGSSLLSLRKIILDIKLLKFPNISLFHLVDRIWRRMRYRGEFTFLFMPHLVEEAKIMMHNLIPCLRHYYREEILLYFTKEAKEDS